MPHKNIRKTVIGKSPVSVGRFTYGHENIAVMQWGEGCPLDIGAFCSIADNVQIFLGGNHRTDWITTFPFGHIFQKDLGGENIQGHPATNGGYQLVMMFGLGGEQQSCLASLLVIEQLSHLIQL
jgi:hypothetical protein